MLPLVDHDCALGKAAEPQFRSLQIDENADRTAVLGFYGADSGHKLAHALVTGVAHIDAKYVGAGFEQPGDRLAAA